MTAALAIPVQTSALPLDAITPSRTNPRKHFDQAALAELAESIAKHGVLQPILVRPSDAPGLYELVAGERRFRAAAMAKLTEIPATVRELSDAEVLEIQVVENLMRQDLHPMEEAQGYEALHSRHKYSVEQLAAKIGKSVAYVYARLKLCALTKEARQAFLEDRFTAGHAILLARLKPADQKRAMDPDQFAIFDHERGLLDHADDGDEDDARLKPRSVREFQAWIDKHVRFDVEKDADPMLFPETAATLEKAEEAEERVIPITHDHMLAPSTRDSKVRTYTCRSWKRADGAVVEDSWTGKKGRSKTCEHSITGIVVAGRDRGDAFKVCIARDKCAAHWPEGVKAKQARQKAEASGEKTPRAKELERQKRDHERYEAERKREEAERERFEKATPAILEAVSAWAREAEADTDSCLVAKIVTDQLTPYGPRGKKALQAFGKVHSAQDILRRAAFLHVAAQVLDSWRASRDFAKWAKGAIGLDVAAILEKVAPAPKEAPAKPKTGKRASS